MLLSAQSIRARGIFTPFHERTKAFGMSYGLGPASYDVRIAQDITLPPGGYSLASTLEHFSMPDDLVGKVADKSSWARKFLTVQNTLIDPGWHGYLTLELVNHSKDHIIIRVGMPIAQITFHLLDKPTEIPYVGKYQNQHAKPIAAIDEPEDGAYQPDFGAMQGSK